VYTFKNLKSVEENNMDFGV